MRRLALPLIGFSVILLLLAGCLRHDVEYVDREIFIFDPEVSDITTSSAIVTWQTTTESNSRVFVMQQDSVSNTFYDPDMVIAHRLKIENLTAGSLYLLLIHSSNNLGGGSLETGVNLVVQTPFE